MKLNLYTIGKRIEALGRAIADIAPALERKPEPEPAKPAPKPKTDLPFKVDDVVQFNEPLFNGLIEVGDTALLRDCRLAGTTEFFSAVLLTGRFRGSQFAISAKKIAAVCEVVKVKP